MNPGHKILVKDNFPSHCHTQFLNELTTIYQLWNPEKK